MKNNFIDTFNQFLVLLKAKVTKTSANQFLESHPDDGSMLAYTDALDYFKIENAVAKITSQDLEDLPKPLLTYLQDDIGTFTIVKSVEKGNIVWLDQQKGWIQTKVDEFSKNWTGIVLFAETDKESGEKDFIKKRKDEILKNIRIPIAISLIGIFIIGLVFNSAIQSMDIYLMVFLKVLGMVIASLLFIKSVDSSNELVNKLCSAGSKINCKNILDSPAAQITPWFSWSDAGFIYFFGSFIGLLLSLGSPNGLRTFLSIQLIFSATAIVFSSYSLYYQGIKAKTWCTLCLVVVTVFILEAIVLSINFSSLNFLIDTASILSIILGFIFPISFLLLFKNTAKKAKESDELQRKLTRLKSMPKVFNSLMEGQPQMPEIPTKIPVVILGNKQAEHTITFVSAPLCAPCAKMHLKIEHLLKENNKVNCQIIFLSNPDKNDSGGLFVRKLFSLPKNLRAEALHLWFLKNHKNFENWDKNYQEFNALDGMIDIQMEHNYWADLAGVTGTPTLFLNGRQLPHEITIEDISLKLMHGVSIVSNTGFANHI